MKTTSPTLPSAPWLYPVPSEAALKLHYVGQKIQDVQAPAAIIDRAVVRRNCNLMLETTSKLGLGFRAHVKTHKVSHPDPFQETKPPEKYPISPPHKHRLTPPNPDNRANNPPNGPHP